MYLKSHLSLIYKTGGSISIYLGQYKNESDIPLTDHNRLAVKNNFYTIVGSDNNFSLENPSTPCSFLQHFGTTEFGSSPVCCLLWFLLSTISAVGLIWPFWRKHAKNNKAYFRFSRNASYASLTHSHRLLQNPLSLLSNLISLESWLCYHPMCTYGGKFRNFPKIFNSLYFADSERTSIKN
jgi:hypothetical protein